MVSEIEKFPSAVLRHHYPEVPNLGDMTRIHEDERFTDTDVLGRTAQTSSNGWGVNTEGTTYTLDGAQGQAVVTSQVRRFTPRECERLQGFPDDYTLIDYSRRADPKKVNADLLKYIMRSGCSVERALQVYHCPDGPRHKALGNSMAVPVMRWLGERIELVETTL